VRLYELCRAGQWREAMALQAGLWSVNEVFARYNLVGAVKAGLRLQGFDCGDPLPPQSRLTPEQTEHVAAALRSVGAL
jgi:4-hydroxy-tetrahydrodipicolinate synthase